MSEGGRKARLGGRLVSDHFNNMKERMNKERRIAEQEQDEGVERKLGRIKSSDGRIVMWMGC